MFDWIPFDIKYIQMIGQVCLVLEALYVLWLVLDLLGNLIKYVVIGILVLLIIVIVYDLNNND